VDEQQRLGFGNWIEHGTDLVAAFRSARPFPHVVIDSFLDPALARALVDEFPAIDEMPKSRDYVFSDKRELSSVERSPSGARFAALMTGPAFRAVVEQLTGETGLFVDPAFHGGGYHQGSDGSFLDLHTDFNVHPLHPSWLRTLNVLLYLNDDWHESYGGHLLIRSSPVEEPVTIAPLMNRAVIMETSDRTYHGYRRMSLPPGVSRRSVAAYVYGTTEQAVVTRTTSWVPESAGASKRLLARYYNRLARVKNRLFGSGTAKNR
jgi:hypothetical protein